VDPPESWDFIEFDTWLREWTMGCDCGSGSTLILRDFIEFDTWLREWTMGCDCGSGSTLILVTLLLLVGYSRGWTYIFGIHACGS